jgi:ABC-type uncharacterized transport system substrate-binding protein
VAVWPLAARAQQLSPGRPIIGVLAPQSQAASARNVEAFRKGLRDLGYVERRNITLEIRYGDGLPERLPQLAAELVALKPAVIRAGSTAGLVAVHNATQTIPLVQPLVETTMNKRSSKTRWRGVKQKAHSPTGGRQWTQQNRTRALSLEKRARRALFAW